MNINDIKINPNNPRYIKDEKYQKLKNSIKEFPKMMKLRPIIIDDNGMILGGNMRYLVMKDLGYTEIPDGWIVKASELTDEEKKRFIIADNVEFGEFNYDVLANEWDMEELQEWGVNLDELEGVIETKEDDFDVDKAIEAVKEPICKRGDIWQLGEHRLMCGDSTIEEDVEKLMDGKKVDMVFTDPPYGNLDMMNARTNNVAKAGIYREYPGHGNFDFKPCWEIIKNWDCKKAIWGGNYFADYLPITNNWLIWDKRAGEHSYFSDCEMAWSNLGMPAKIFSIVWSGMIREGEHDKRIHPTQKPINLAVKIINEYAEQCRFILDLFGGSGSTLIACEQLNRKCFMMEIDPIYCDVIIKRWEQYTQKVRECHRLIHPDLIKYTHKKAVKIND